MGCHAGLNVSDSFPTTHGYRIAAARLGAGAGAERRRRLRREHRLRLRRLRHDRALGAADDDVRAQPRVGRLDRAQAGACEAAVLRVDRELRPVRREGARRGDVLRPAVLPHRHRAGPRAGAAPDADADHDPERHRRAAVVLVHRRERARRPLDAARQVLVSGRRWRRVPEGPADRAACQPGSDRGRDAACTRRPDRRAADA